jgi:hypothetical protein
MADVRATTGGQGGSPRLRRKDSRREGLPARATAEVRIVHGERTSGRRIPLNIRTQGGGTTCGLIQLPPNSTACRRNPRRPMLNPNIGQTSARMSPSMSHSVQLQASASRMPGWVCGLGWWRRGVAEGRGLTFSAFLLSSHRMAYLRPIAATHFGA